LDRHLGLALVIFGLVTSATLVAAFLPKSQYESTTIVAIQPANSRVSTTTIEYVIPSIQARIGGGAMAAVVADQLPGRLGGKSWAVSSSVVPGSGVLRITVTSRTPELPKPAADAYAHALTTEPLGSIPVDVVSINPATDVVSVSKRNPVLISGLGLAVLLGLLGALARLAWSEGGTRDDRELADLYPHARSASRRAHQVQPQQEDEDAAVWPP
jgi:hypothetical protein